MTYKDLINKLLDLGFVETQYIISLESTYCLENFKLKLTIDYIHGFTLTKNNKIILQEKRILNDYNIIFDKTQTIVKNLNRSETIKTLLNK